MTGVPEEVAVVQAATRLLDTLQTGREYGVFAEVLDLQRVLADFETVQRRGYEGRLRAAIERAAGLAGTHEWRLVDSGARCARCPVDVGAGALLWGAVPACNPNTRCAPFAARHLIAGVDPSARGWVGTCVYCRTEYPATAETMEVTGDE